MLISEEEFSYCFRDERQVQLFGLHILVFLYLFSFVRFFNSFRASCLFLDLLDAL
jgi:hypothetical protein